MTAVLPAVSDTRIPADTLSARNAAPQVVTRTRVVDCPSYAWDNSDQGARDELGTHFYSEYHHLLDEAAHELMRQPLIAEWRRQGRLVRLVEGPVFTQVPDTADEFVDDDTRWGVWQRAVDQITGAELVFAAGLVDEYAAWGER